MLFLQFSDSSIRQITFDPIDRLDGAAISTIQKAWGDYLKKAPNIEDISIEEQKKMHNTFRENVQEMLQKNRNKLNTLEGYGIIDGEPQAEHYLEFEHIPLISVQKILLLSDGLNFTPTVNPINRKHGFQQHKWPSNTVLLNWRSTL